MNFLCRGLASNDLVEKSHELRAGMPGRSSEDFTTLGVERRKEQNVPWRWCFSKPVRSARPGLKGNTGSNLSNA